MARVVNSSRHKAAEPVVSELQVGDAVQLYPSFATYDEEAGQWLVRIRGTVFQPRPEDVRDFWVVRLFERFLQPAQAHGEEDNFVERMRGFLRRDQRGRKLVIQVGNTRHALSHKSARNGHFADALPIDDATVQRLAEQGPNQERWLNYGVVGPDGEMAATGRALLLAPRGTSVISDIDDTIKVTEVTRPSALLANTFLRPFAPIPSMPEIYAAWAAQGVAFHYVSSSPNHLFDSLTVLVREHGFPAGSYHLTPVGSKNPTLYGVLHYLWDFYMLRRKSKLEASSILFRACPERKFVLVGDSGERDLEMYSELARTFPTQVARIYLRVLPERTIDPTRRKAALAGLSGDLLHEFNSANELPREL